LDKVAVVGAGVSGLTLAQVLLEAGKEVYVIEKEKSVGGLARTFFYNEGKFDIGPHRFHTDDEQVLRFIKRYAGSYLTIPRISMVYFNGHYFNWPLKLDEVFKLPLSLLLKVLFEQICPRTYKEDSFRNFVLNRYGKTLTEIFFKDYTEKFCYFPLEKLHPDWGNAGLNRAVIDKKIKVSSLFQIAKSLILPLPVSTTFIYPENGIYVFSNNLYNYLKDNGCKFFLNTCINKIHIRHKKIHKLVLDNNQELEVDFVFFTAPLTEFFKLFKINFYSHLPFINTNCFNFILKNRPSIEFQWCYAQDKEIPFVRISMPHMFSDKLLYQKFGLCVEITSRSSGIKKELKNKLADKIISWLIKMDLIRTKSDIENFYIEEIKNTYPVYHLNYKKALQTFSEQVVLYCKNIKFFGRCGSFYYNNMDHSIKQVLDNKKIIVEAPYNLPTVVQRENFWEQNRDISSKRRAS